MVTDLLVNAERAPSHRPPASRDRLDPMAGYWLGSVGGRLERWRQRALSAEAEVARLRAELARWGFPG